MNFFETLAQQDNVDITLRIMKKGDKLTLNLMPGSNRSTIKPYIVTGTGKELDEEFFPTVYPELQEVKGLQTNIEEVKKSAEKTEVASEKKSNSKTPVTSAIKAANKKKKEAAKKETPIAPPDLFAAPEAPADDSLTDKTEADDSQPEEGSDNAD